MSLLLSLHQGFPRHLQQTCRQSQEIISIHITSRQSGTVQVAELLKEHIPIPITVVDSESASMGQGFAALAAARAALRGKNREEILEIIERVKQKTAVFVAVPTLKYLARSGKVSRVQAMVATLLTIKPILGVKDGLVQTVDKKRSYSQARAHDCPCRRAFSN